MLIVVEKVVVVRGIPMVLLRVASQDWYSSLLLNTAIGEGEEFGGECEGEGLGEGLGDGEGECEGDVAGDERAKWFWRETRKERGDIIVTNPKRRDPPFPHASSRSGKKGGPGGQAEEKMVSAFVCKCLAFRGTAVPKEQRPRCPLSARVFCRLQSGRTWPGRVFCATRVQRLKRALTSCGGFLVGSARSVV